MDKILRFTDTFITSDRLGLRSDRPFHFMVNMSVSKFNALGLPPGLIFDLLISLNVCLK